MWLGLWDLSLASVGKTKKLESYQGELIFRKSSFTNKANTHIVFKCVQEIISEFFYTKTLLDIFDHAFPQLPFLYYLPIMKTSEYQGSVLPLILHGFEFNLFILLDWLPTKAVVSNLSCNFTYSRWRREE